MPKGHGPKLILEVCQESFNGTPDNELAQKYGVSKTTISGWRKLNLWKEFEAELIDAHKQNLVGTATQAAKSGV